MKYRRPVKMGIIFIAEVAILPDRMGIIFITEVATLNIGCQSVWE